MQSEYLLDAIVEVGEGILVSGGEIYRVEDSIRRMLLAYDIKKADVFTIISNITVTIHTKEGQILTNTRRILETDIDLKRLDMLNSLSRYICKNCPEPAYIYEKCRSIMNHNEYGIFVKNIAYAVVSWTFCFISGGSLPEQIISGILGIVLMNTVDFFKISGVNIFVSLIGSSYICGVLGSLAGLFWGIDSDAVAIGNIMLLIPGLTITNAIRDFITGDLMAGILRLCDGLLIATCLALGFSLARF